MLFRGNAEADIRRNLVRKGYIKGIIGLPANLFYGTGIPACIVVIDKEDAQARKGIFMIDASRGFMKDGPKNRLRAQDIHKIVDVFNRRLDVPKYARMVSVEEIERNDFNLNLPRYIDSRTPEDVQDIAGHLQGGIPVADVDALDRYWAVCPSLKSTLFHPLRSGYSQLSILHSQLKHSIYEHPEFASFVAAMNAHFVEWREQSAAVLKALKAGFHPKELIVTLSESLLAHYAGKPLIDPYDIYQHLMDYWAERMQDDCYLIAADGWKAETTRIIEKDKKGKEKDKGWSCDLIPKALIVARYFAKEQAAVDQLAAELEGVTARLAELEEEQGGEEGAFADLDKVNKAEVTKRLKEIHASSSSFRRKPESSPEAVAESADDAIELQVLNDWLKLNAEEAYLKKRLKEAEATLDAQVYGIYPKLTESEIKTLVVDDKWLAALDAAIHGEMDRVSQQLTQRVKELAERYETPLPQMISRVAELEAKVNRHLERMGFLLDQGIMKDLLTGKKRLQGFSGAWTRRQLGEVIENCSSGATPYRGRPEYYKGTVKWITSGELNYNLITDTIEHISEEAVEKTNLKVHPVGTFLMAITGLEAAGTRGACGIVGSPATTNQSCMAIYPTPELKTEFLYHYYVLRGNELALRYCQGTKQQSYTAKLVRLLPIDLPPTLEEPVAIVEVLSDISALITTLEARLAKARQIKQGMMQELLTGRIRLV